MNDQTTGKYSILCSCLGDAMCPQCCGHGVIAIGNITFKDMQKSVMYSVKEPFSDDYSFGGSPETSSGYTSCYVLGKR